MAPLRPSGFAGRLSGLDRSAFVEFLADLWEGRGRDVRVEDGFLIEGDGTRLFVHHPPRWRPSALPAVDDRAADGIVTSRRVGDVPDDARVIDADDLREMVLYAVARQTREALSGRYFDGASLSREAADGHRVSARVGAGAVGTAGALMVVAAVVVVVAAGGLGGLSPDPELPAPPAPPADLATPTATPDTPTPRGTPTGTRTGTGTGTSPGATLLTLDRDGTQYDDDPYPVSIDTDGGVAIIDFDHPDEEGFFALWTDEGNGTGRFLAGGQGAGSVRVLVDLPPGRHTLFVRAIGTWHLEVRSSRPPSVPGLTRREVKRGPATAFAGPLEFRGPTNVNVRGIDPNATYHGVLVDPEDAPRRVLVDRAGPTGTVSTLVEYRGTGFVRMSSTGRWVVTLRPADRDGPPYSVGVLRDGADGRRSPRDAPAFT